MEPGDGDELCLLTQDAAYAEHRAGGYVFTDDETVAALAVRFDTLRGECRKVSESATLLEDGRDMDGWRKSTYSDGNGGSCVETTPGNGVILVRDKTDRDGATLTIPAAAWKKFTAAIR